MKLSTELTIGIASQSNALYPGDILVSKSSTFNSSVIAGATCAPVSHAGVVVDALNVVDAAPNSGVGKKRLTQFKEGASLIIHLRHKQLLYAHGLKIAEYVLAQQGKPYDMVGAAAAGLHSGCNRQNTPDGMLVRLAQKNITEPEHDVAFFCSELVARAYESVGLKLSSERPWLTLPGGLLTSDQLVVMGRLA